MSAMLELGGNHPIESVKLAIVACTCRDDGLARVQDLEPLVVEGYLVPIVAKLSDGE